MSSFFQPPHGSSGSRTIYTVLHERAQNHSNDIDEIKNDSAQHRNMIYSPALSSSSSTSGSSYAPSSPSRSDNGYSTKYYGSSCDKIDRFLDFDATDMAQLDAVVPACLRRAIDAAKYSSLGDFGTEICWEALPPIFALPKSQSKRHRVSWAEGIDEVPFLSELTEEQQRVVVEYLSDCRNCNAAMDDVYRVAARANLPSAFILYYLSLI